MAELVARGVPELRVHLGGHALPDLRLAVNGEDVSGVVPLLDPEVVVRILAPKLPDLEPGPLLGPDTPSRTASFTRQRNWNSETPPSAGDGSQRASLSRSAPAGAYQTSRSGVEQGPLALGPGVFGKRDPEVYAAAGGHRQRRPRVVVLPPRSSHDPDLGEGEMTGEETATTRPN